MPKHETIRCPTKKCASAIEQYGEHYHSVVDMEYQRPPTFMPDAVACCERCGGWTNGETWIHQCQECGINVEAGGLRGLFVPHLCQPCEQKKADANIAAGRICISCRKPFGRCCC